MILEYITTISLSSRVLVRGDQQLEQEPESDPEFSHFGRSLNRSRSGNFFKKPDQEPEPELRYGSCSTTYEYM